MSLKGKGVLIGRKMEIEGIIENTPYQANVVWEASGRKEEHEKFSNKIIGYLIRDGRLVTSNCLYGGAHTKEWGRIEIDLFKEYVYYCNGDVVSIGHGCHPDRDEPFRIQIFSESNESVKKLLEEILKNCALSK